MSTAKLTMATSHRIFQSIAIPIVLSMLIFLIPLFVDFNILFIADAIYEYSMPNLSNVLLLEYIDTNILISLIDKNDNKYEMVNGLIKKYNSTIITELNLIEMRSVLSRIELQEEEVDALIDYLFIKTDIKILDV